MEQLKLKFEKKLPMYKLPNGKQVVKIVRKYLNVWGNVVIYEFYVVKRDVL